jgi:NAD(P)-dependent dehydrogenase (short-subunit alcohol dehydrogenase family)
MQDTIVVITGTSRGVGVGIAHEFLRAGATVIGCSRRRMEGLPGADTVPGGVERSRQWVCDQDDWRQVRDHLQRVVDEFGRIDVLVNNAGGTIPAPHAEDVHPMVYAAQGLGKVEDDIERTVLFHEFAIRNNLLNPMTFSLLAARHMKQQDGWQSIINISSAASDIAGSPTLVSYGAAKIGMNHMTASLAQEWGEFGIRVNCLALGATITDGFTAFVLGESDPEGKEYFKNVPIGRGGHTDEVGKMALMLSSGEVDVINGATIRMQGGMSPDALYEAGIKTIKDLIGES